MAIAKTRVHIICGICGSNEELSYEIEKDWIIENEGEPNEIRKDGVVIHCGNCSSITGLEEIIKVD